MSEYTIKGVKFVVNACVNRTVAKGLNNLTAEYGESVLEKAVRFIGVNGLSLVITVGTKKILNDMIDEVADKIVDFMDKHENK